MAKSILKENVTLKECLMNFKGNWNFDSRFGKDMEFITFVSGSTSVKCWLPKKLRTERELLDKKALGSMFVTPQADRDDFYLTAAPKFEEFVADEW